LDSQDETLLQDSLQLTGRQGIVRFGPEARVMPRVRTDYELWCVLEGSGEVKLDGDYPLRAGLCFVFQPGDRPGAVSDPKRPLTVFYAHFEWKAARPDVAFPKQPVLFDDYFLLESCARVTAGSGYVEKAGSRVAALLAARLVLSRIIALARHPDGQAPDIEMMRIVGEIRRNPAEAWSVAALARRAGLSPPHFIHRFKRAHGIPPKQFIVRSRIDRACQLLETTALSVKQVAAALNYRDEYFFNRQFKAVIGAPPNRWRKAV
jgi:AraC-like DNA-binding protein